MPIYEAEFLGEAKPIRAPKEKKGKKPSIEKTTDAALIPSNAPYGLNKKGKPYKRPQKPVAPTPVQQEVLKTTAIPKRKRAPKTHLETPPPSEEGLDFSADAPGEVQGKQKKQKKVKPAPTEDDLAKAQDEVTNEPAIIKKVNKRAEAAAARKANKKIIVAGETAEEPPTWFKAYLHDEQKRRNADKPKKERMNQSAIKQQAEVQAAVKWSDGLTKDRVTNEVNSHMNRLYQQIHGGGRR